jgi:flagellar hook-associated protein 2
MVTQITLGNVSQQNGRTVVGGGQSAFDTESIINSLVEAKRQPAVLLESQNETITAQQKAFTDLRSLLSRFKSAADVLRNPPGVQNAAQNIFQYRTATLASSTGVDPNNYLSVTVQPGATTQGFSIDSVDQIARETKQQSNNFLLPDSTSASVVTAMGAPQAGLFSEGTFQIRRLDGGSTNVTLAAGDSLQTVANKFNEVKGVTGVQATVLKVADGSPDNTYTLIFTATKTGLATAFDLSDPGTITGDADGVLSQMTFNTTQTALNAQVTIDGVQVERQTNAIADAITGVTFNLKQQTPALTTLQLNIEPDTEIVANAITQFADVYNEFRIFAAKQSEVDDDGLPKDTAVLSNNSTLRSIISQIGAEATRIVDGITGGNPAQLGDIGVKFQDFGGDEENPFTRNIMVVDSQKLSSALQSNFDGVKDLFEFRINSQNANLTVFKRTNALSVTDITLNIDRTNNIYQATYTDAFGSPQTVDLDYADIASTGGVSLKGKTNPVLQGLELIFAQTTDATFDVHFSQGIGDRLFNTMDSLLKTDGGVLTNEESSLTEKVSSNDEEITKLDDYLERYREQLIEQYSRLEEALSKANNLLQLLDAQAQARNSA